MEKLVERLLKLGTEEKKLIVILILSFPLSGPIIKNALRMYSGKNENIKEAIKAAFAVTDEKNMSAEFLTDLFASLLSE